MHRLIGSLILGIGITLAAIGAIPWIYLATRSPRPYHYYYIADTDRASSYGSIGMGILLILIGACVLYRNKQP